MRIGTELVRRIARQIRELERARRGARDDRLEPLAGERLGERLVDAGLVLDEQDAGSGRRHWCML
jgi:hypothetical protein